MTARTVQVHSIRDLNAARWKQGHVDGSLPSEMPYGLDLLGEHDLEVRHSAPTTGAGSRLIARAARGVGHRWDWWGARASATDSSVDVHLCWDERSGIPMATFRELDGPPVVTGVIWLTDERLRQRSVFHAVATRALGRSAAVWALSAAQLPLLRERFGLAESRVHHLPFGIDTDFWSLERTSTTGRSEGLSVLAVGNDRDRDHPAIVRAMTDIGKFQARLTLVSSQPVDPPPHVGTRISDLSHVQLRRRYATADVVAMATRPNLHVSGMTTLLEAQAMQRPVVATRTPGMSDYVIDGVTGLLVAPGDDAALAEALRGLLADPARREEMGRAGRSFVERRASTHTQAGHLARLVALSLH